MGSNVYWEHLIKTQDIILYTYYDTFTGYSVSGQGNKGMELFHWFRFHGEEYDDFPPLSGGIAESLH